VALPFSLKGIFKTKRRIMENSKYFTMQKYNLQKKDPLKENQFNPSRYYYNLYLLH